jgi:hypothetical protein
MDKFLYTLNMSTANLKDINIGTVRAKVIECKEFDTEELEVNDIVALESLRLGNPDTLTEKILHVQSRTDAVLFLEGDTDDTSGTDNPVMWLTQDGKDTVSKISMLGSGSGANGLTVLTSSVTGTTTQHIDFYTNATHSNVGTGNLPILLTPGKHMMRMRGDTGVLSTKINQVALGDPAAGIPVGTWADEIVSTFSETTNNTNHTLTTTLGITSYCGNIVTGSGTLTFPAAGSIWTAQVDVPINYVIAHGFVTLRIARGFSAGSGGAIAPVATLPAELHATGGGGEFSIMVGDNNPINKYNGHLVVGPSFITFYSTPTVLTWFGNVGGSIGFEETTIVYYKV